MAEPQTSGFFKKEPKQSRSRALVDTLIQAVEQLLDRSGDVNTVSTETVARRAGVGIGSLYDYFANGEGVLGVFLEKLTAQNFETLEAHLRASRGQPVLEAVRRVSDAIGQMYLDNPNRTRGAIMAITRLGWVSPVIRARDRFAQVLAARLLESCPELEPERAERACLHLCDAVMGMVTAQAWRPTADVREAMFHVSRGVLEQQLGLDLSKY